MIVHLTWYIWIILAVLLIGLVSITAVISTYLASKDFVITYSIFFPDKYIEDELQSIIKVFKDELKKGKPSSEIEYDVYILIGLNKTFYNNAQSIAKELNYELTSTAYPLNQSMRLIFKKL